ncbi:GlsB/YeaQ/YmgE family stress response membrane protein [Pseudemcibacter aquimaris]|uniref:GlsB/YeaQ/YmgE family stress response membrane protein n=1 Tax=Pseudemcibacter aquimaris TaxID=2857064 RepID=UPI0020113B34|nr:GlsB/YeaQ/YmgE family stress response membrane protein [Pseudemcibacter aquimaris]MCC3860308.1 GlsB/YeaQ/YmgE family stress response membrane protein [Pseudemcibacter aquimaris]WDU57632.1 GlsB/YeaQ/YmgE family stress response membrane protein [Pseudemcibacter aquimaris]
MNLIWFLIIGGIAGWLAGNFMKGSGHGIVKNVAIGVAGAFLGGFLFNLLGLSVGGMIGSLVSATVGAVILLFMLSKIKSES